MYQLAKSTNSCGSWRCTTFRKGLHHYFTIDMNHWGYPCATRAILPACQYISTRILNQHHDDNDKEKTSSNRMCNKSKYGVIGLIKA
ncbi:hypothetical protein NXS19_009820 [Fusarium pseudograminearum]|nr:hypothetical protein NXS19_009820 [Fusarium pseudograminearum]